MGVEVLQYQYFKKDVSNNSKIGACIGIGMGIVWGEHWYTGFTYSSRVSISLL